MNQEEQQRKKEDKKEDIREIGACQHFSSGWTL